MQLCGVCIYTNNAPRLAAFYETVLQEAPLVEGQHFGFPNAQLAVYDPGAVNVVPDKSMSLMFYVGDLPAAYARLLQEIPDLTILSPPQRKPWGAYSFLFTDPDGNTVSFIEKKD